MFSAVLLLQCVEQRHLRLDQPIGGYGVPVSDGRATLRQMLSHTSPENQGHGFKYDPARYAELAGVMEHCAPQPFRKSVVHRLLERLAMIDSVPGRDLQWPVADPDEREVLDELYGAAAMTRYTRTLERMAVPYKVDKRGRAARTEMPADGINAASGLVTTVRDLARFDAALDAGLLLSRKRWQAAWSPRAAQWRPSASPPTGLGWFVQCYGHADRLAVRPRAERLLRAVRQGALAPRHADSPGQRRRPRRAVPARNRRRDALALRDALPAHAALRSPVRRASGALLLQPPLLVLTPAPRRPNGSSRRSSATPSGATTLIDLRARQRRRPTGIFGGAAIAARRRPCSASKPRHSSRPVSSRRINAGQQRLPRVAIDSSRTYAVMGERGADHAAAMERNTASGRSSRPGIGLLHASRADEQNLTSFSLDLLGMNAAAGRSAFSPSGSACASTSATSGTSGARRTMTSICRCPSAPCGCGSGPSVRRRHQELRRPASVHGVARALTETPAHPRPRQSGRNIRSGARRGGSEATLRPAHRAPARTSG